MATVPRISPVRGALAAALYGRDTWLSLSAQHGSFMRFFVGSFRWDFLGEGTLLAWLSSI